MALLPYYFLFPSQNIQIKESVIKKMKELSKFKFLISSAATIAEKEAVLNKLNSMHCFLIIYFFFAFKHKLLIFQIEFGTEGIKYSSVVDESKLKLVGPKIIHGNIDVNIIKK